MSDLFKRHLSRKLLCIWCTVCNLCLALPCFVLQLQSCLLVAYFPHMCMLYCNRRCCSRALTATIASKILACHHSCVPVPIQKTAGKHPGCTKVNVQAAMLAFCLVKKEMHREEATSKGVMIAVDVPF